MFKIYKLYKELTSLVKIANSVADQQTGDGPKWSFFLTNRSFLVPAIGIVINILLLAQMPFLSPILAYLQAFSPQLVAEHMVIVVTAVTFLWSLVERLMGKTRVVWNKKQCVNAVCEAYSYGTVPEDKLSEALRKIGVMK